MAENTTATIPTVMETQPRIKPVSEKILYFMQQSSFAQQGGSLDCFCGSAVIKNIIAKLQKAGKQILSFCLKKSQSTVRCFI